MVKFDNSDTLFLYDFSCDCLNFLSPTPRLYRRTPPPPHDICCRGLTSRFDVYSVEQRIAHVDHSPHIAI